MPAKKKDAKKEVKEEVEQKVQSDQDVANSNAIGSLSQEATNQHDRLSKVEEILEKLMSDMHKVLSRMGL
jgi:hypothetical protein